MSKQRPNLADITAAAGSTRRTTEPESHSLETGDPKPERSSPRVSTRAAGTKQIAAHFPAEVSWQLRELAAERRTTVQALLGEALNDLFQKHGKPEIAPLER
ncbi:MAG: ribbon-helix-helix domain-containing protein [Rhodospirillaceae bacterium]